MTRLAGIIIAFLLLFPLQAAYAACSNPAGQAAAIVYNATEKTFQYCNDTDWIAMNAPGSGVGGCANPAIGEGQMSYNTDYRVLQGCAGNVHMAFGPVGATGWTKVSLSINSACGIRGDGALLCWGTNSSGQLGTGNTTNYATPVRVSSPDIWIDVSVGGTHACGIKSDGTLWCWGSDASNQIGNGATAGTKTSPVNISGGQTWLAVSSGTDHNCAIRSDNTVWCWGSDSNGQIGDGGSGLSKDVPRQESTAGTWKSIASGTYTTCAINMSDALYCWGRGANGVIGNGATADQASPAAVNGGFTWKSVSVGDLHTCAVRSNDAAYCWGRRVNCRLGDGGACTGNQTSPVIVSGSHNWLKVSASSAHSCGIKTDGSAMCWGQGSAGGIGNGTTYNQYAAPTAVTGGSTFSGIASAPDNPSVCAIETSGNMRCWGTEGTAELFANGGDFVAYSPIPLPVTSTSTWKSLAAGGSFGCGIKADDTLWCWGGDSFGRTGTTNVTGDSHNFPLQVSGGGTWKFISPGPFSTCGIKSDDSLWCWGDDAQGELGDGGGFVDQNTPVAAAAGQTWASVSVGGSSNQAFTCGIKLNGSLWCWGDDNLGQLGNGATTTTDQHAPVAVAAGQTWKKVTAGGTHACAIRSDDTLWCWGSDIDGQVGDGAGSGGDTPVQIGSATWISVSAGAGSSSNHTCGIQTDSSLWCWGDDSYGKLGNGGALTADQPSPVQIASSETWLNVSAGVNATCAIRNDKKLFCWGRNNQGQLGDNTVVNKDSPTAVHGGGEWETVSAGRSGAALCALSEKGQGYCWGDGGSGELGNELFLSAFSPTQTWCGEPEGRAGAIAYNSSENLIQYCDGTRWVGAGGFGEALAAAATSSGLVGYWTFNETSGSATASDSSVNGNDGTLTNMNTATAWVAGHIGNSLNFDGTDDAVDTGVNLLESGAVSVSAWIYPTGWSDHHRVIGSYNTYFYLNFYAKEMVWTNDRATFANSGGNSIPSLNQWYHVAAVRDGSGLVTLYINGAQSGAANQNAGSVSANIWDTFIGARYDADTPFQGKIDEVRVYNRALSVAEIQALAAQ